MAAQSIEPQLSCFSVKFRCGMMACTLLCLCYSSVYAVASSLCVKSFDEMDYAHAAEHCEQEYGDTPSPELLHRWMVTVIETQQELDFSALLANLPSRTSYADTLVLIADLLAEKNKKIDARLLLLKSVSIYRQENSLVKLCKTLNRLFLIEWRQSSHRLALQYAWAALQAAREADNPLEEVTALRNLFIVFEEGGNLGAAKHILMLISARLEQPGSTPAAVLLPHRINNYINQGLIQLNEENYSLAALNFDRALIAAKDSNNRDALRGLHLNIAHANMELGRLEKAENHLAFAWQYARKDGSMQHALLYYQAKLSFIKQEYKRARAYFSKALASPDLSQEWQWQILYWLGRTAQELGLEDAALTSFEKSLQSLETLRKNMAYGEFKTHLLARRRLPYEALFIEYFKAGRLQDAFSISEKSKASGFVDAFVANGGASVNADIDEQGLEEIANRIDQLEEYLVNMRVTPTMDALPVNDVLATIGERSVVSFFLAQERLFSIGIFSGALKIVELNGQEIESLLQKNRVNSNNLEILASLGSRLFPQYKIIEQGEHLFISPDTLLNTLSFSALRLNDQYIIQTNSISLVPSVSALVLLQKSAQAKPSYAAVNAIVIGDPSGDLPSARREAVEISRRFDTAPIIGGQANLKAFADRSPSSVLHIAAHTGVGYLGPWIRLADGEVFASSMSLGEKSPTLAVLASCASGVGAGEYLWGSLGGQFLAAGTPSVVVSQGAVEDKAVHDLMRGFYDFYLGGDSPAVALAQSQRRAIGRGHQPQWWASFVVLGDPSAKSQTKRTL